ncbi:uncharacterized protein [Argopecten irradians]|uniref:uncharacterized protein n=1 Tax=Argopecten irradians TaxID=31199 RepID=UPI0037184723
MPSFWKILCFPNHRYGNKNNTTSKRPQDRDRFSVKTRLEHQRVPQTEAGNETHFPAPEIEDDAFRNVNRDSQKGLIDDDKTKKRRRVQDIFNTDNKKDGSLSAEKKFSGYNGSRTSGAFDYPNRQHVRRVPSHREFGSGYTPQGCRQNANNHVESMYRYVPKVVQNVYASKALEGKQIDDFFNRLHRESSMTHFATKPLQIANDIVMQHPPRSSRNDDKTSLIPQTEIDSGGDILNGAMDVDDDYSGNVLLNMAPRSRALNTNFEQIWNSTGEVLY